MALNKKSLEQNNREKMLSNESFFCKLVYTVNEPYHYHPHWHDFTEMLFVKTGCLKAILKNTMLKINAGELLVVMPGELHSFDHDGKGVFEYIYIQIDSAILQSVLFNSKEFSMIYPYLINCQPPRSFLCSRIETEKNLIPSLLYDIYSEFSKKELGFNLSIRAKLLEIYVWLLRRWNRDASPSSKAGNFSIYSRMQPIFRILREQYSKKITTNEIADKMAMSIPHFCRLFKRLTGNSFQNYLQSLRITEAIKLILSTDNSIKEIASIVGFNDVNFFVRVFKKQIGIPPFQYKKKYAAPLPSL
ncbi:MAG: AraC family transcriptional regulator [Treponema sp.]|jgi:AraC-like DNA-binding protein/mannose-6-phosphate isomerase-like protein (cupin superfamily)|nr:AraC family transcriptional regulator [Treponema sp.]